MFARTHYIRVIFVTVFDNTLPESLPCVDCSLYLTSLGPQPIFLSDCIYMLICDYFIFYLLHRVVSQRPVQHDSSLFII